MVEELWYIIQFEFCCFAFLGIRYYQVLINRYHKLTSSKYSLLDRILVVSVLLLFYFCMIYYPLFPNGTLMVKPTNVDILRMLGTVIAFLSLLLLLAAAMTLKKSWSAFEGTYDDQQLITTGIYRFIRHPIYLALFCFILGISLTAADPVILILLLPPHIWLYFERIPKEEALLREKFGDKYQQYQQQTGAFWPKLHKK